MYFERQCICFDVLLNLIICNAQSNTDFNFHENLYKHINKIVLPINYINMHAFHGFIETPILKGDGRNSSQGAQQMLVHKKVIFDSYYCIKHIMWCWKLHRFSLKHISKFSFSVTHFHVFTAIVCILENATYHFDAMFLCFLQELLLILTSDFVTAQQAGELPW